MNERGYIDVRLYSDRPPVKMSEKIRRWIGSCRHESFYEPQLIDLFFRNYRI